MVFTQIRSADGFALPQKKAKSYSFWQIKKSIRAEIQAHLETLRRKDEREWIGAYNTPEYMDELLGNSAKKVQAETNCLPELCEEARRAIENDYYVARYGW
jgi:hypothetical protein